MTDYWNFSKFDFPKNIFKRMKKILVTGGAGYIGSHLVKKLAEDGFDLVVLDNLSRGHIEAVHPKSKFENVDLLDKKNLLEIFDKYKFDSIIHFAAFAYVGESVEKPGLYYENNVSGSLNLIRYACEAGIKKFVFSSTCSVYGNPVQIPISEKESIKPINPYAFTKFAIEQILNDFEKAFGMKYTALRYFNAAGADPGGSIGESHNPEPHLIPIVLTAALGKREKVFVFGDDYETPDGTCIRDYIHVNDLADAHIKALMYLNSGNCSDVFNLGTGSGNSVKEIIETVSDVTGVQINYEVTQRRPGDPAVLVADNSKAKRILGWNPKFDLKDILTTAWQWHQNQKF